MGKDVFLPNKSRGPTCMSIMRLNICTCMCLCVGVKSVCFCTRNSIPEIPKKNSKNPAKANKRVRAVTEPSLVGLSDTLAVPRTTINRLFPCVLLAHLVCESYKSFLHEETNKKERHTKIQHKNKIRIIKERRGDTSVQSCTCARHPTQEPAKRERVCV